VTSGEPEPQKNGPAPQHCEQVLEREFRLRTEMRIELNRRMQLERERMEAEMLMEQSRMMRGFDDQSSMMMRGGMDIFGIDRQCVAERHPFCCSPNFFGLAPGM
jgi:hypothetical protein